MLPPSSDVREDIDDSNKVRTLSLAQLARRSQTRLPKGPKPTLAIKVWSVVC
jgi:hypothetical protein